MSNELSASSRKRRSLDRLALGPPAPALLGDVRHAEHRQGDAKRQDDEGHHHRGEILPESQGRQRLPGVAGPVVLTWVKVLSKNRFARAVSNGIEAIGRLAGRLTAPRLSDL